MTAVNVFNVFICYLWENCFCVFFVFALDVQDNNDILDFAHLIVNYERSPSALCIVWAVNAINMNEADDILKS